MCLVVPTDGQCCPRRAVATLCPCQSCWAHNDFVAHHPPPSSQFCDNRNCKSVQDDESRKGRRHTLSSSCSLIARSATGTSRSVPVVQTFLLQTSRKLCGRRRVRSSCRRWWCRAIAHEFVGFAESLFIYSETCFGANMFQAQHDLILI